MASSEVCATAGIGIRFDSDTAVRTAASINGVDFPLPLNGNGSGRWSTFRRTFPFPESALFRGSETTLAVIVATGFRSGAGMGFLSFAVVADRPFEEFLFVESLLDFDGDSTFRGRCVLDLGRTAFFCVAERGDWGFDFLFFFFSTKYSPNLCTLALTGLGFFLTSNRDQYRLRAQ